MKENIWVKAATAAFGLLAVLAGWGLNEIYRVEMKVVSIETKLDIWMTPTKAANSQEWAPDEAHMLYASMPLRGDQGTDFARKAMIRAADQILAKDCDGAVKTLLVGLENTGSPCFPAGDHLDCK